jgi:hypothetical protein
MFFSVKGTAGKFGCVSGGPGQSLSGGEALSAGAVRKPPYNADFIFCFVVDYAAVPEFQRRYQAVPPVAVIAFRSAVRGHPEKKIKIPDIQRGLAPPVKIIPCFKLLESPSFVFDNKTDPVSQVVPDFNFF